jgi:hypothetical protein
VTVFALSVRPPENTVLLLMSFAVVLAVYCVTPLPLSRQMLLALPYSAATLLVCRQTNGAILSLAAMAYAISNTFGGLISWRLNRRRREEFLGEVREATLRSKLEQALAQIRTLRGQLCICAWCKRIRDEAEAWQAVESFVQSRTHAAFTHGICPECFKSQTGELPRTGRSIPGR